MKSKNVLCGLTIAVVLQLGMLAGSAQTNIYLFSGSETNITLNPGTYIITVYGAVGGGTDYFPIGGYGAKMSAEFSFSAPTTLTLLVGGGGGYGQYYSGGGGGGGSFVVEGGTPLVIAGGGGGGSASYAYGDFGTTSPNGDAGGFSGDDGGDGAGGTGGGGGSGGSAFGSGYSAGGGGGGFLSNGTTGHEFVGLTGGFSSSGAGGISFENGGFGGSFGQYYSVGGYGGGGYGGTGGSGSGGGGGGGYSGGGGGGNEEGPAGYPGFGGGGGSIIDATAIAILHEFPSPISPDGSFNGEIIITVVPTPLLITKDAAFGFTNGVFGFDVSGPSGATVVIQASTDLQTWIPLQTNLLGNGPLYFSDTQSTTNVQRFYRAQLSP